ncbi:MAG: hypothetical protein RDV41_12250 [Planctomycetota bacterium]|nr:hypothetical protein [Planctomycetota bacterium]
MKTSGKIGAMVAEIAALSAPSVESLGPILGAKLVKTKENRYFEFFELRGMKAPFGVCELRLSKDTPGKALLVLNVAEDQVVDERDLSLDRYGAPARIDVNPDIPPEGTVAREFSIGSARVSFQMTANSGKLRLIAVEWGAGG